MIKNIKTNFLGRKTIQKKKFVVKELSSEHINCYFMTHDRSKNMSVETNKLPTRARI